MSVSQLIAELNLAVNNSNNLVQELRDKIAQLEQEHSEELEQLKLATEKATSSLNHQRDMLVGVANG